VNALISARIHQLRALAALWVFIFHYTHFIARPYFAPLATANPFKLLAYYGYAGVSLFFCLSGLLFAQTYCPNASFKLWDYYAKRLLRILPAFCGLLLVYELSSTEPLLALPRLFGQVFALDIQGYPNAIGHLWSINRELQCYLLFPLLWWCARHLPPMLLSLLGISALSVSLLWAYQNQVALPFFYGTFGLRWFEFIVGMLAGIYLQRLPHFRWQLMVMCLFYSGILTLQHQYIWETPLAFSVVSFAWLVLNSVLCASFIVAYLGHTANLPDWAYQILENIGRISYSFYLYHFLIIGMFARHREWMFGNNPVDMLWILALSLCAAWLSYNFIEQPGLKLKRIIFH
jgi:peptidoglycan/LPS O-acetylase OafA/YrhL